MIKQLSEWVDCFVLFCFVFPHTFSGLVTHCPLLPSPQQVVLENGTEAFDAWKDPPAPIYMQFYFFNLTNPLEALDGERPAVVEIGPYTYR